MSHRSFHIAAAGLLVGLEAQVPGIYRRNLPPLKTHYGFPDPEVEVFACNDVCAHQGGPLSEGKLSGARLACPWHGWMYDVRTGECMLPGRGHRVASYPIRIDAGEVWVEVP